MLTAFGVLPAVVMATASLWFSPFKMRCTMYFASEPWDAANAYPAPGVSQAFATGAFQIAQWILQRGCVLPSLLSNNLGPHTTTKASE